MLFGAEKPCIVCGPVSPLRRGTWGYTWECPAQTCSLLLVWFLCHPVCNFMLILVGCLKVPIYRNDATFFKSRCCHKRLLQQLWVHWLGAGGFHRSTPLTYYTMTGFSGLFGSAWEIKLASSQLLCA